jgi:hypothetical protein
MYSEITDITNIRRCNVRKLLNKLWEKVCVVGTHISAILVLMIMILIPLAVVTWIGKSILGMWGVF